MNVLLVDDDIFARNQLKMMLDWTAHGFQLEGEAGNGISAIQELESKHFDIVITDMSMPVMNGVELIETINACWPSMKVIALSSYSDYAYIRQSMKSGAIDYMLKHELSPASLLGVLEHAKGKIEEEKRSKGEQQLLIEQLSVNQETMVQHAMQQILLGRLQGREEIVAVISTLQIPVALKNIVVIVCQLDNLTALQEKFHADDMDRLCGSFVHISREIIKEVKDSEIFNIEIGKWAIVLAAGEMTSYLFIHNLVFTTLNRIRTSIKQHLNLSACFSVSELCGQIADIHSHYFKAEHALSDKFFRGKDKVIFGAAGAKSPATAAFQGIDIKTEKELTFFVQSLNAANTSDRLHQIFSDIHASHLDMKSVQLACVELVQIIRKVAKDSGITESDIFQKQLPYDVLMKFETIEELKAWILHCYQELIHSLSAGRILENCSEYARKAYEYIDKSYSEDISLQSAADSIGISSSYLSKLFKQDFGIGFSEYLNEYRVERAQLLIQSGIGSLKDIVGQVGFNNYNYFFRVFKSVTGMTPAECEKDQRKSP
jgi:two-component system response regulator YesN